MAIEHPPQPGEPDAVELIRQMRSRDDPDGYPEHEEDDPERARRWRERYARRGGCTSRGSDERERLRVGESVVVDASVGLAYVRDEVTSAAVDRAVAAWSRAGARLVVPAVFWLEVVNVLGTKHRYRAAQAAEALRELDELGLETVEIGRPELLLVADAVERHRLPAYDATYLVLARQLGAPLATLDRQLAAAAGPLGMLLGEERGPRHARGRRPVRHAERRPAVVAAGLRGARRLPRGAAPPGDGRAAVAPGAPRSCASAVGCRIAVQGVRPAAASGRDLARDPGNGTARTIGGDPLSDAVRT